MGLQTCKHAPEGRILKSEYEEFNRTQKITSDFDKEVQRLLEANQ